MNYKIFESTGMIDLKSMIIDIEKHISEGWIPAGGLCMSTWPDGGSRGVWQAMWKPLDKEERDGRNL
jgi:hypothetical protein